jgi:hypothetical protein
MLAAAHNKSMRVVSVLAVLLVGCDPAFRIQGDVADPAGHPIAGARAVFTCGGADQDTIETDASGHFDETRIGVFGNDCAVEIRLAGHGTGSFPVMENCTDVVRRWFHDDMCAEVTVHATLR